MTVKNGYVSLNADANVKNVQEAGIFYNADNNSAYINFNFNNSIDLKSLDYGYVILKIDNEHTHQLDLQLVDSSNKAFIAIPGKIIANAKHILGEVYLKYKQNTLLVGKFKTDILDSLLVDSDEDIANVYVPRYEEIQNNYNDLKRQFEELGLGTFEESVRKVITVLAKDAQIYPALKGLAEQDKTKLVDADANNLPVGIYECTGLINAPENLLGHTVHSLTMGGSENRRQTILIDSDTGEMFYRVFGSEQGGEDGARVNWMRLQSECILWENMGGSYFEEPVRLKTNIRMFNTVRIRAYINKIDTTFYGKVDQQTGEFKLTLNTTNIYDDLSVAEWLQGDMFFIEKGEKVQVKAGRIVRLHLNNNNIGVSKEHKSYIKIVEIAGVM